MLRSYGGIWISYLSRNQTTEESQQAALAIYRQTFESFGHDVVRQWMHKFCPKTFIYFISV